MCRSEVIAAYPISQQTHTVERSLRIVQQGDVSILIGASAMESH